MSTKFTFYTGTGKTAKGEDITDGEKRETFLDEVFKRLNLAFTKWKAHGAWGTIPEPILIYEFIGIPEDVAQTIREVLQKAFEQTEILVTVAEVKKL